MICATCASEMDRTGSHYLCPVCGNSTAGVPRVQSFSVLPRRRLIARRRQRATIRRLRAEGVVVTVRA